MSRTTPSAAPFSVRNFCAPAQRTYSEETAREIDCAVRELVARVFQRALDVLGARRATLDAGARQLLEKETLNEADLNRLAGSAARSDAPAASVASKEATAC